MNIRRRKAISAVLAAAICSVSLSAPSIEAGIIIDHDSSGIDKGFYYEYANSDKDSTPVLDIESNGCFDCEWDNDEDFTAVRGVKFASPVEYSTLGDMKIRYWRRIEVEKLTGNGYVRFGIRLHNSDGDSFTILETDATPDETFSMNKDGNYTEIGKLDSYEIMNDYTIFGIDDSDRRDVGYTIYSRGEDKGTSYVCRRDTTIAINNFTDDTRKISLSDKLDAIAATGVDIGDITDIIWFVEAGYSKGEANIHNSELMIENMPELLSDSSEDDEAPLHIKSYDSGVRNGYYYCMNDYENSDMEVLSPSLFRAGWDTSGNQYESVSSFERGKEYKSGQSYKAVSASGIDYTMNFDAEGKFSACTYAELTGPETEQARFFTEMYIIDACSKEWAVSESAVKTGSITAYGNDYDVYFTSGGATGSFKTIITHCFYFVNRNAIKNGEKGTVSAKYELAPFIDFMHEQGAILGSPRLLSVMLKCVNSKGKAELTRNEVTLPDYIAEDDEFKEAFENYDPENDPLFKLLGSPKLYKVVTGTNADMNRYAIDKYKCSWKAKNDMRSSPFTYKQFSLNWNDTGELTGFWGYKGDDSIVVDYNIDMGELSKQEADSRWIIGSSVDCNRTNVLGVSAEGVPEGSYFGSQVVIADRWEGDPQLLFGSPYGYFADSQEPEVTVYTLSPPEPYYAYKSLGTIESDGVEYDVSAAFPYESDMLVCVLVTRKNELKASADEDVPDGFERYANTVNVSDILNKMKTLGFDAGAVTKAGASLFAYNNEGTAVINSADVRLVADSNSEYTADDVQKLTDFLLGKKVSIAEGRDYDLNGDGVWDTFDLIALKKRAAGVKK